MEKDNVELRRMREEVEQRIAERATQINQSVLEKKLRAVKTPVKREGSASSTPKAVVTPKMTAATAERESAVARVRREREERNRSVAVDEDVEMRSVGGSGDEDILEQAAGSRLVNTLSTCICMADHKY
jgi:hypothetical protein